MSSMIMLEMVTEIAFQSKQTAVRIVFICLVTRQMFRSACLTKHGQLFTHFMTSFICSSPSLVVKSLLMCNFNTVRHVFVRYLDNVGLNF